MDFILFFFSFYEIIWDRSYLFKMRIYVIFTMFYCYNRKK